jgi:hypothetical protein
MRRVFIITAMLLGALVVPSGALGAATLDQAQDLRGAGAGFPEDITPPQAVAQVFTAGRTGMLTEVWIIPTGNAIGKRDTTIEIRDSSGGLPGTTVLARATVKTNQIGKWIRITLRPGAAVTAGTQYALVVVMNGPKGIILEGQWGNPYTTGDAYATTDVGWSRFEDIYSGDSFDFAFRTYLG